jgi:hypothetical protein
MRRGMICLFLFGASLWPGMIWANPMEVVELVGNGEINWSQGVILAKGSGAPPKEAKNIAQARLMAERAALSDARRNLVEVLKGVRVDSATTVENFMVKSDQIRLSAEGFVQGSAEIRDQRKYLSDGAIEVTVAMNLTGDFLTLMLSQAREPKELKFPKVPPAEKPAPQPPPVAPEKKAEPAPEPPKARVEEKPVLEAKPLPAAVDLPKFTGLVIDTRGLNMRAALIPRLLDENGREIYQGQYVPQEKAGQNGVALYARDLTAAQTNPRVGKSPLTIKGSKVNPNNPSEIILSAEDAKRVVPFAHKGTFLEECKVMIVLD